MKATSLFTSLILSATALVFLRSSVKADDPPTPAQMMQQFYNNEAWAESHYGHMLTLSGTLQQELVPLWEQDPEEGIDTVYINELWYASLVGYSPYYTEHGNFVSSIQDMASDTYQLLTLWGWIIEDADENGTEAEYIATLEAASDSVSEIIDEWDNSVFPAIDIIGQDVMNIGGWMNDADYEWMLHDPATLVSNTNAAIMYAQGYVNNARDAVFQWDGIIEMYYMGP